jgi:hypothetical protein
MEVPGKNKAKQGKLRLNKVKQGEKNSRAVGGGEGKSREREEREKLQIPTFGHQRRSKLQAPKPTRIRPNQG